MYSFLCKSGRARCLLELPKREAVHVHGPLQEFIVNGPTILTAPLRASRYTRLDPPTRHDRNIGITDALLMPHACLTASRGLKAELHDSVGPRHHSSETKKSSHNAPPQSVPACMTEPQALSPKSVRAAITAARHHSHRRDARLASTRSTGHHIAHTVAAATTPLNGDEESGDRCY